MAVSIKIYMHIIIETPPPAIHPMERTMYVQKDIYIKMIRATAPN